MMESGQSELLSTGIDILDRKLGGGIPPGTVVALSASPASQSELFLYEFADIHRTVYLSTIRTEDTVEATLENRDVDARTVETIQVDTDKPLKYARNVFEDLPTGMSAVVDPMCVLEECDRGRYRQFLADLKGRVADAGTVGMLHCLRNGEEPYQRRDTVHVADLVFELSTEVDGQSIVNRLTVPKFRGGQSVEEVIKLDLVSEVEVDVSRNIV